ncbi:MAG: hypothetical protein V3T86_15655, partial [Planctomycetota bacterium]
GGRKAGATAVVVGVAPTPAVALNHVWRGTGAGLMVTASHNFRDQNGLKIFRGTVPLKLFPDDDRALTDRVLALDYAADVAPLDLKGAEIAARDEAMDVFSRFHLDPRNSWLPPGETTGEFPLVVDAANGAMSGIAAEVLRALHGGEVTEVNADVASGDVNRDSGVADLEGVVEIKRDDERFKRHRAVIELFLRGGCAAVFDGDGDRFYRLDHDAESDTIHVLSGDETAVHQAAHLAPPRPGTLYINTVESDLNAARAAADLGYTPLLTGVGDKWVLQQAASDPANYGIGSEETGHNISRGMMTTKAGDECEVFLGNGLKSAINTFVATRGKSAEDIRRPFTPGFKRTFYVYYTNKQLLAPLSEVFTGLEALLRETCTLGPVELRLRPEEPDMLYLAVLDADGGQRAGVFARNSGTEEKTGINVRGRIEDAAALTAIGEAAWGYLAVHMKDREHAMTKAELAVLQATGDGPRAADDLPVPEGVNRERLLLELSTKEKVLAATADGYERTAMGDTMLEALS